MNCNAHVYGKYCHICGQENIEPEETALHLVTHFFNDITHFDGKFFSTTKLLAFKPGFLTTEYKRGRRAAYLNPVRMYIFTSFIFFLIFFSLYHVNEIITNDPPKLPIKSIVENDSAMLRVVRREVELMDSFGFDLYSKAINGGHPISKNEFNRMMDSVSELPYAEQSRPLRAIAKLDSSQNLEMNKWLSKMDSSTFDRFTKTLNSGKSIPRAAFQGAVDSAGRIRGIVLGNRYSSKANLDSIIGEKDESGGWLNDYFTKKMEKISKKYGSNTELISTLLNIVVHYAPQMLFISLPLFALFLKLLYIRRKEFYFVSHGIFSIHLYIFYFITFLLMIGLDQLFRYFNWPGYGTLSLIILLLLLLYEYKAMRNFYRQGRAKTMLKFLLATGFRFFIILLLLVFFIFYSVTKL